jgi:SagB-type dehydrogenase family enzyme
MKRRTMLSHALAVAGGMEAVAAAPASMAADEPPLRALPPPQESLVSPLQQALRRRRSVRGYSPQPIALAAVSQLLWAAQGVTAGDGRRTAPSAGALYPLELQLAAARVTGLPPGVYRYIPASHGLRAAGGDNVLPALALAAHSQQSVAEAAAVLVIAAVEERTARKYGARAGRYVAFEAGAASQNLALQAAALGLGSVVVGAFDDGAVADAVRLATGERPVALMPIGIPG